MLFKRVTRIRRDESGVTAIEYGLIAGSIAVAIITAVTTLGTDIAGRFTAISGALAPADAPVAPEPPG